MRFDPPEMPRNDLKQEKNDLGPMKYDLKQPRNDLGAVRNNL